MDELAAELCLRGLALPTHLASDDWQEMRRSARASEHWQEIRQAIGDGEAEDWEDDETGEDGDGEGEDDWP